MMEKLHHRVTPSGLNGRIDATYFRSDFRANAQRLHSSGMHIQRLDELVRDGRRAVYFSTTTRERVNAPSDWVSFLTADDLGDDGFFIDEAGRRAVSPSFADRYPHGVLRSNEILVKVKGPNQITAYCAQAPIKRVLISGTLWGACVLRQVVDPHYLLAALSCPYASVARTRLRTNLNVEFLSPDDLLQLELPVPKRQNAQRFVGEKVRIAEGLHRTSNTIDDELRKYHVSLIPSEGRVLTRNRTRRVGTMEMTERFDAHFYPAAVSDYFGSGACNFRTLQQLNAVVANGTTLKKAGKKSPSRQATVANLSQQLLKSGFRYVKGNGANTPTFAIHDLAFCNAAHSKEYVGKEVTYVDKLGEGVFPSTEVMLIRIDRKTLPSSFVRSFLLTDIGYLQLQSTIRGITAHSYPTDVKTIRIPVPELSGKQLETFRDSDRRMLLAAECKRASENLVLASKHLVEALINRKITEEELATAQTQLEQGDQSADRSILTRLFEGGIDATDTRQLFPDLDAYYETLQMAEQALADGGDE